MVRSWVRAVALLAVLPGLVSCTDDPDDSSADDVDSAAVAEVLSSVADDPADARALLSGRPSGAAADAGIPTDATLAWLVAGEDLSDQALDAVGTVLATASGPAPGSSDEDVVAALLDADRVDPRLRPALAGVVADRIPDAFGSARAGRPWRADQLAVLLGAIGADEAARATVTDAVFAEARTRLAEPATDPGLLAADVASPAGWLIGALDSGAVVGMDEADATAYVADRRLELETLAEDAARAGGRTPTAAQSLATTISGGYSDGLATG